MFNKIRQNVINFMQSQKHCGAWAYWISDDLESAWVMGSSSCSLNNHPKSYTSSPTHYLGFVLSYHWGIFT